MSAEGTDPAARAVTAYDVVVRGVPLPVVDADEGAGAHRWSSRARIWLARRRARTLLSAVMERNADMAAERRADMSIAVVDGRLEPNGASVLRIAPWGRRPVEIVRLDADTFDVSGSGIMRAGVTRRRAPQAIATLLSGATAEGRAAC